MPYFYNALRRRAAVAAGILTGRCPACGLFARLLDSRPHWPELIAEWGLDERWASRFYEREGKYCELCGSKLRCRQLAKVLVETFNARLGTKARSLAGLCAEPGFGALDVAEVNAAGSLHQFLSTLPRLRYSEYPEEDLTRLSYTDESFDLLITSETLEHVPDVGGALAEVRRVLKPGGLHVFTVPVVSDRPTRRRASLNGGGIVHHLPPSYHAGPEERMIDRLVFHEFGSDFAGLCERAGFRVAAERDGRNPALVVFVAAKPS